MAYFLNTSYGLRGVLLTAADAAANTFIFFMFKTELVTKTFFKSANEASYYGAFDRARNADSDALKIAFIR